ncbi:MAG TPA: hypothetical protein VMU11_03200 [Verrucomicrobiae bacterium]|nr:hypothetical protein [Verrucomicrobiae bacterium]
MKKPQRIEWVSLLYLLFFVLAVLSPSLITHAMFGLTETQLEELTIFSFGIAGLLTFSAYERLMERREQEAAKADADYGRVKRELIESYAYIGSMNRKIELLKKVANEASLATEKHKQDKELFMAVAQNASAAIGAKAALIRFVSHEPLRTEAEFSQAHGQSQFKIANKELVSLKQSGASHAFLRTEDGHEVLVVPSDHREQGRAYLLLTLDGDHIQELDVPLLKVFANQAEMLYRNVTPVV